MGHGRELVFVLHSNGALLVWDLLTCVRIFNHSFSASTLIGAIHARLWVGEANSESSIIPLAVLCKSNLEIGMEMVNVYRLQFSSGDKINVSLEPSISISLDEGGLIYIRLASNKMWILKEDGLEMQDLSVPNAGGNEQFLQQGKMLEGEDLDFAYESISAFSTRRDNQEAVFGAEEGVKDIREATSALKAEALDLQRQLKHLQSQYDMLSGQASTLIQGRRARVAATSTVNGQLTNIDDSLSARNLEMNAVLGRIASTTQELPHYHSGEENGIYLSYSDFHPYLLVDASYMKELNQWFSKKLDTGPFRLVAEEGKSKCSRVSLDDISNILVQDLEKSHHQRVSELQRLRSIFGTSERQWVEAQVQNVKQQAILTALKAQVTSDEAHIHLDIHSFRRKHAELSGEITNLYHKEEKLLSLRDLNHTNQYIVGLALCELGNISSAEMARDLAPEVERLLLFRDPNIRKKAALCSIRIIKKVPDLAENFVNSAAALLKEKHHGVLLTGVQLCTDLCKVSTEALEYIRKRCTEGLVKVLKDVVNSPCVPEYDVSGIADPFLHIRLLRLLRVLGHEDADASDCMNDILAQVASKTESNKNAGNAILYECVQTIMSIEDNSGLRVLAINILGRFLSNRDNNIRYVALNMLMRAITVDSQAVQRHRATILECVKDSDALIRKRALELVYLLVNENNVKLLTKDLIDYLEISDQEFKGDLTAKICSIVEKFSPEKMWYIDQMLQVLSEAGNYVKNEVWHALIVVISNASNLHGYTVRLLYRAVQKSVDQEVLVRVAVWCIGEYGYMLVNNVGTLDIEEPITVTDSDTIDVIETAIKHHTSDLTTRAMCLIALLKLSCRFPSCSERIQDIIIQNKRSLVLELQ